MRYLVISMLSLYSFILQAQESEGNFFKDGKSSCTIWFKNSFPEDSASWDGPCKNNMAEGYGTVTGYRRGKAISQYVGYLQNGKPNGQGKFTFEGDRKLEGNFVNGEILNLKPACMRRLEKNTISTTDSLDYYVGDNNAKLVYYHFLSPEGQIKGTLVLLPGTWESTEHLLSSTQSLCELAFENHLAVIVPSINQRLTMNKDALWILNTTFSDAIMKYHLPKEKFVIGGWSMGGLFSLRYTELANMDNNKTRIKPVAVFSCDGPCDLENIYKNFQKKLKRNPDNNESAYGIRELEKYTGGSPDKYREKYIYYSAFSLSENDGGNTKYLTNTPVRIYDDVDPSWWLVNRKVDMYDMNSLDQTAMILMLNDMGNKKAEFINAYGKGYRLEGNRHPHSWSIVEPNDCIKWVLQCIDTK